MRRFAALFSVLAGLLLVAVPSHAGITTSKHNLSASGPGTVKASSETQTCVFCHAPHNASTVAPLWNRASPGGIYTPYTSSTSVAHPGQPTGASLLCLSCHDGTIALGDVLSRGSRIGMAGGATTMPAGNSNLGTDLSNDHPVSFTYNASVAASHGTELANPSILTGKVKLDASGQMQCTTCHDPHDDTNGKFLVVPNNASALCQTCHSKNNWSLSSHKLSTKTGTAPAPTRGRTAAARLSPPTPARAVIAHTRQAAVSGCSTMPRKNQIAIPATTATLRRRTSSPSLRVNRRSIRWPPRPACTMPPSPP